MQKVTRKIVGNYDKSIYCFYLCLHLFWHLKQIQIVIILLNKVQTITLCQMMRYLKIQMRIMKTAEHNIILQNSSEISTRSNSVNITTFDDLKKSNSSYCGWSTCGTEYKSDPYNYRVSKSSHKC